MPTLGMAGQPVIRDVLPRRGIGHELADTRSNPRVAVEGAHPNAVWVGVVRVEAGERTRTPDLPFTSPRVNARLLVGATQSRVYDVHDAGLRPRPSHGPARRRMAESCRDHELRAVRLITLACPLRDDFTGTSTPAFQAECRRFEPRVVGDGCARRRWPVGTPRAHQLVKQRELAGTRTPRKPCYSAFQCSRYFPRLPCKVNRRVAGSSPARGASPARNWPA